MHYVTDQVLMRMERVCEDVLGGSGCQDQQNLCCETQLHHVTDGCGINIFQDIHIINVNQEKHFGETTGR